LASFSVSCKFRSTKIPHPIKWLLISGVSLAAILASAVCLLDFGSSKVPLHARIVCADTNLGPTGDLLIGWRFAVIKVNDDCRFWDWACWIEQTNRIPSLAYETAPLLKSTLDWEQTPEAKNEHGILMGSGPGKIDTNTVYRVIGRHAEQGVWAKLPRWAVNFPRLLRLVPEPKGSFATSEWFAIEMPYQNATGRAAKSNK
jgi:hypothetical protein